MKTTIKTHPKWGNELNVRLIGDVGQIKSFRSESNTGTYVVEMQMGGELDFGRIGAQTTILLHEDDILGVVC